MEGSVKKEDGVVSRGGGGGGQRAGVCQKFQAYSIDKSAHLLRVCPWPTLAKFPCPCLHKALIHHFFPKLSRWWPHKAQWKMSRGGVREAIWGLIDGSRRTIAAMFSDIPMCKPCLAPSWKREKFFSGLMPLPNTLHYISHHTVSVFQKIDDEPECVI